ncbi:coiled-coil domain-containing protein 157-like [Alligator sinensis]|uniref:Coiled-coil domain-containing protein 157-like n=1 Tax=Alligator sinensis TaxID=38654 RepID=A0A3Q0GFG8_ALLSI|nr:coiled-coil domain-containing protein 157-like [Alligator sinensis]
MQREMAAWREKSTATCTTQVGEQKEMLQRLEVSKSLILQKEIRGQEDHVQELQDEVEKWQQKYMGAEQLIQMLRNTLHENQALTEEKGKVLAHEMGKVKEYMANYDALQERNLSLERELEAGVKENDRLQSQLQSVEAEKDHLEEQIQSLKTLLEDGAAKEALTNNEREQALHQMQALSQQVQALEAEKKMLQVANRQMATKGQDPRESEVPETTSIATQTDAGQKDLREEAELGSLEGSNPEEGLVGTKSTALEGVLPAFLDDWNKRWDQWLERHAEEMSHIRQQLRECYKPRARWGITVPHQRPLGEAALIEAGTVGKNEQASSRKETNNQICQDCTQERQGVRRHKPKMNPKEKGSVGPRRESEAKEIEIRGRELPPKVRDSRGRRPQIYVQNIPGNVKWWTLRKLVEAKVGGVAYVKIYKGPKGESTGRGKIEFWEEENAQRTLRRQWEI